MADRFDAETEQEYPEEMVIRAFSRCQNYPKERAGVLGLAQGLRAASDRFGVPMADIIRECVESSSYCPTDTDLLAVARGLTARDQPALKPWNPHPKCPECGDSGWRTVTRGGLSGAERCPCKSEKAGAA